MSSTLIINELASPECLETKTRIQSNLIGENSQGLQETSNKALLTHCYFAPNMEIGGALNKSSKVLDVKYNKICKPLKINELQQNSSKVDTI